MRFLSYALPLAASLIPLSLCANFTNFQLTTLIAHGILGSYATFILDIVNPSTMVNNSITCQYAWYAPGMLNATEIPTDSNISWNSSTLNENYVRLRVFT
jgi:hypothetical protein